MGARWQASMVPFVPSGSPDLTVSLIKFCCILSFGWSPGVWILCADVSEHTVCSICIGRVSKKKIFLFTRPMNMEQSECSETSAYKIQTPENHPKERKKKHSLQDKSLKSRIIKFCRWLFRIYWFLIHIYPYVLTISRCSYVMSLTNTSELPDSSDFCKTE